MRMNDLDDPPPQPPVAPRAGDCCRGGCDPCVFDLHQEELARYELALEKWKARHAANAGALKELADKGMSPE